MDSFRSPVLSIITVVYNNVEGIERTIQSVVNQSYDRIQYLIIDGGSTDGTLEVIKKYSAHVDYFISEPDRGIYDAMNKGLANATGEYVLFMNSGDEIWSLSTVERVFDSASNADIYYGETEMFNAKWESLGRRRHHVPVTFNWKSFRYGMCVSHQAIYIRRALVDPYDLSYQLSADIDWIIKAAKKAEKIVNVHQYVAKYLVGGMSKKRHLASLWERFRILKKHYGILPTLINHVIIVLRLSWYYLLHGKTND